MVVDREKEIEEFVPEPYWVIRAILDFEDIEIKANATELLKKALKNKKEKVMIGTGSMTDPYIPLENKRKYHCDLSLTVVQNQQNLTPLFR